MAEFSWFHPLMTAVERERERIFAAEAYLWQHPATGFREWEASEYLAGQFASLGYEIHSAGNIPGFYADIDTGRPGPALALLGELDSVLCPSHPDADTATGAVHACGHHTQGAALLGAAAVLRQTEAFLGLCGRIRLIAVPAEELLELAYREQLRQEGIIRYFGGKSEFLYRGYFDGIDMAMMVHAGPGPTRTFTVNQGNNGCLLKNVRFTGKAAHAGGSPHKGINALYAATLGLQAINALRETFRESDHIRVHPIITRGGSAVNVIPDDVTLESYVRGSTIEAILRENKRVSLALAGAAASLGARLEIADRPGYMPLHNDPTLTGLSREIMDALVGPENVRIRDKWEAGSTDMGDLSCLMPVIQPVVGGAQGELHEADFRITDHESACVLPAKLLAGTACALLAEEGALARQVIARKQTVYSTPAEYFQALDAIFTDRQAVVYRDDGSVLLNC
ncbi:MAG TPA: amidohydrolase [Clostridiales bacterium]|nr:amidohydrolase [Clostridiales bacterium]